LSNTRWYIKFSNGVGIFLFLTSLNQETGCAHIETITTHQIAYK